MHKTQDHRLARKQPLQARSKASVHAILDATVQILSTRRATPLTTKKIAVRAGLSIGSLYQYFPNKEAIVLALISKKAEEVAFAFEEVALKQRGQKLVDALRALTTAYFAHKFSDLSLSKTLHARLDQTGGTHHLRPYRQRMRRAIESAMRHAPDVSIHDFQGAARMIWGALSGAARSVLETDSSQYFMSAVKRDAQGLIVVCAKSMTSDTPRSGRSSRDGHTAIPLETTSG